MILSVICPVLNGEKYIIDNILTFFVSSKPQDKELLIIDGGSGDRTIGQSHPVSAESHPPSPESHPVSAESLPVSAESRLAAVSCGVVGGVGRRKKIDLQSRCREPCCACARRPATGECSRVRVRRTRRRSVCCWKAWA